MKIKKSGFTLIELLVVIAIIGLLSVAAVVAVNSARLKAANAKRVQTVEQYYKAMSLYYAKYRHYPWPNPSETSGLIGSICLGDYAVSGFETSKCWGGGLDANNDFENEVAEFIPDLPKDTAKCGTGSIKNYRYQCVPATGLTDASQCQKYQIWFALQTTDQTACNILGIGKFAAYTSGNQCVLCYIEPQ